jgi:hypothetical protein
MADGFSDGGMTGIPKQLKADLLDRWRPKCVLTRFKNATSWMVLVLSNLAFSVLQRAQKLVALFYTGFCVSTSAMGVHLRAAHSSLQRLVKLLQQYPPQGLCN